MTPTIYVIEYQDSCTPDTWRLSHEYVTTSLAVADEQANELADTPGIQAVRVVQFQRDGHC